MDVTSWPITGFFSNKSHLTVAQVRQWSSVVKVVRMTLPAVILTILFFYFGLLTVKTLSNRQSGQRDFSQKDVVTMVNPRFTGRDSNGERYEIVATSAQRRLENPSIIDLIDPIFTDVYGSEIRAPAGAFDRTAGTLNLTENVRLKDSEGYKFNSENAVFYVADRKFVGNRPLNGEGPMGKVRSGSYEVLEEGDRILLAGNVEMLIFNGVNADEADALVPRFEDLGPIDFGSFSVLRRGENP